MSKKNKPTFRNPWTWVPTLYYAEGIPYIIVMTVSVIMYKRLGISNTDIALYTSWLYLPWVIKPLWSPIIDILRTKRLWIIAMQLLVGAGLAGVALTIPVPNFFQYTLAFFWLIAFSSATHDIAADGFYMLGMSENQQAFFVGVRSTFYRFAMITGQGLLVILAGYFEAATGLPSIELNAKANPNAPVYQHVQPDSMKIEPMKGELRIVTKPDDLEISTKNVPKERVDSLVNFVRNHNAKYGFYEDTTTTKQERKVEQEEAGIWDRIVTNPLENFLAKYFGPEELPEPTGNLAGNTGMILFHLSKEPVEDKEIVVNFGIEGGDESIALEEGNRFVFTPENWNKPAIALIQLDKKLDEESQAVYEARAGNVPLAWVITFFILAGLFVVFFIYHKFILPYPKSDHPIPTEKGLGMLKEFLRTFVLFFKKRKVGIAITFLLVYRLGESQIVKLAGPFMLDAREVGGLGLTTGEFGIAYGTIGLLSLTVGGILGGFVAAKKGLRFWIWWMLVAMNLPNLVWVVLSYTMPDSFLLISLGVGVEQFGYGFGFTSYMLYMIYVAEGDHKTSHFAICTGFMALGMMLPGMISGWLQEIIGYQHFFIWVMIATIPAFIITKFVYDELDPKFGIREGKQNNEATES